MANLLLRDYEKEETPRLEKASLVKEQQTGSQVKGIREWGMAGFNGHLVWGLINLGYKMYGVLSIDTYYQLT
jgi:hypothetical protein